MQHTEWKTFRRILVSSILATDNKNHTIVLAEFDAIVTEEKNGEFCQDSIEKLLGALLHCCDFWGNVKPYPISKQWSERVNKEFSHQYEKELEAGVEPTPYFRDLNNIRVVAKN
jgi:cAMP-specific phosphodiesterase 4